MRIVIAGAGEVGTHLAYRLSGEEQQSTTLIDSDKELLRRVQRKFDAYTIVGDPTKLEDLQLTEVHDCDLFVSVMPGEAENLLACMLAAQLGAKRTIARINNHRYLAEHYRRFFGSLGVDQLIYPEELAAEEIANSFKHPWARVYVELLNGAFVLVGVKVRKGSILVGRPLSWTKGLDDKAFHVVSIKRGEETLIPDGQTVIEHGDVVFFTCLNKDIDLVRQYCDKDLRPIKRVVILGGSLIALRTVSKAPSNIDFHLIERDLERIKEIEDEIPSNVKLYDGDGRDLNLISEIGLDEESIFVALTENSETNILACLAAKRFQVAKTIAKEENIDYIPLAEKLDIGTIINKKVIAAGNIFHALLGSDTKSIKSLTIAHTDVAELQAKSGSAITERLVKELDLPKGITLGGLVRNGVPMLIDGNMEIQPYDSVVVFCTNTPMEQLSKLFD